MPEVGKQLFSRLGNLIGLHRPYAASTSKSSRLNVQKCSVSLRDLI